MNSAENKRIISNTGLLYVRMFVVMGISIFTSRIILQTLGVSDYGLNNLVSGIVGTFTFIVGSLSTSVQRFLSIAIGQKDVKSFYGIFKSSQHLYFKFSLVLVLLSEILGFFFLPKLNIPPDRLIAAHWVFQLTLFTLFLNVNSGSYQGVLVANEKFSITAMISIVESVLRLLIVILLMYLSSDKLISFAILSSCISATSFFLLRKFSVNLIQKSNESIDRKKLTKELLSYSSWNLIGALSIVARSQGIIILLNLFFGVLVNAAYAIANQIKLAIEGFSSNFTVSILPQITQNYGAGNMDKMEKLIMTSTKISFFLLFIITFPIIMEIDFFLKLWLGKPPMYSNVFSILILVNALIDVLSTPLLTGIQATGRIKVYQLVLGSLLIANFPICYVAFLLGASFYAASIISIFISIICFVIRLYFARKLLQFSVRKFISDVVLKSLLTVTIVLAVISVVLNFLEDGVVRFFLVSIFSSVSTLITFYFVNLKMEEKDFLRNFLKAVFLKWSLKKRIN